MQVPPLLPWLYSREWTATLAGRPLTGNNRGGIVALTPARYLCLCSIQEIVTPFNSGDMLPMRRSVVIVPCTSGYLTTVLCPVADALMTAQYLQRCVPASSQPAILSGRFAPGPSVDSTEPASVRFDLYARCLLAGGVSCHGEGIPPPAKALPAPPQLFPPPVIPTTTPPPPWDLCPFSSYLVGWLVPRTP